MKRLSVLFFAVISILAFSLTGCSNGDTFTEKSYSTGKNEVEKIVVQVTDRELEISASEDERVYIDYFDSEKEYLDITVSDSKELTVKLEYNKDWTDFIGTKPSAAYRKIQIKIPDKFITMFSASTTNENIKVNPLSFTEQISLNANGGNIVCDRINAGKAISFIAKNGNITGTVIGGWDDFSISCKIKKGNCNLPTLKESGEKSFTADCNNGDINIEFIEK